MPSSRWRLACFDLDGTLVRGSTCMHLAAKLGHLEYLTQLEQSYAQGRISNSEVADGDGPYYAGRSLLEVREFLTDIPFINGIDSVVGRLAAAGVPSLICTVTWQFAAEIVASRFGFVGASGVEMHHDQGVLTGRVSKYFDEFDKLAFVKTYCAERSIDLSDVFAVGDSRSDLPLFGAVGFSVALNATKAARATASVAVDTNDLADVLSVIPGLTADTRLESEV